jgi:FMN phosphatase YigB (HAD superfamily)
MGILSTSIAIIKDKANPQDNKAAYFPFAQKTRKIDHWDFTDMLKAVLFDLDNTLIFFDEVKFANLFFPLIAARFADVIPADEFGERLMLATLEAHKNDGAMTNRQLFLKEFCKGTQITGDDVWKRFDKFYEEDFDRVKETVTAPHNAPAIFQLIRKQNVKIVIATNPILPLNAQRKRLSWAGLDGADTALITHIDNMCYCKPHLGYFRQISQLIGERPEDCLMVGDDPANDMVAANIGMKTYKTVDSLNHVGKPLELSKYVIGDNTQGIPPADFEGPLSCVPEAVVTLLRQ